MPGSFGTTARGFARFASSGIRQSGLRCSI